MSNTDRRAALAALLTALYPCPNSPTGHHRIAVGERTCLVAGCRYGHAPAPRHPVYSVTHGRKV